MRLQGEERVRSESGSAHQVAGGEAEHEVEEVVGVGQGAVGGLAAIRDFRPRAERPGLLAAAHHGDQQRAEREDEGRHLREE